MSRRELLRYGPHPCQVAELWSPRRAGGPFPAVVLVHGGFFHGRFTRHLMWRLAADIASRGWVAWNIEYRRLGRRGGGGGWPTTLDDVAAAVDHLRSLGSVDHERVALCGHSVGGQLALWCAARSRLAPGEPTAVRGAPPLSVRVAVSLGGLVDLDAAARLDLGAGAVAEFMGGGPDEVPDRYRSASPAALLPLGVPQVLIHGRADRTVPVSMSARYADAARALGDPVEFFALERCGHLDVLLPSSRAWRCCVERLSARL